MLLGRLASCRTLVQTLTEAIQQICDAKGVILEYLPPYSPDLNPIEMLFNELKAWMRRNREISYEYDVTIVTRESKAEQRQVTQSHPGGAIATTIITMRMRLA